MLPKVPIGPFLTLCLVITFEMCYVLATDQPCKPIVTGDLQYDLNELGTRDYVLVQEMLHTEHKKEYYLSVCHPLRNVPVSCPSGKSGVCSVTVPENGNTSNIYQNMGEIPLDAEVKVADVGRIEYIYKNGEKCTKTGQDITYTTELHLMCPHGGGSVESLEPVLMSSPGCILFFAWITKAACPKKLEEVNATTCTVKFSNSDHQLNLHALHSASYYTLTNNVGSSYEINICGPVTNGHCGIEKATICKVESGSPPTVMGTTDDMKLIWTDSHLKLLYGYGGKTVEIQFFCDRTVLTVDIYYVMKNETTEVFSVKTNTVCTPEPPQCIISDKNGNVYDLRPLHKATDNWDVIQNRDGQKILYHINICGAVNNERYYHCPPGYIGACQASVDVGSAYNLGLLTSHPVVNGDGSITVLYTGGEKCKDGQHARSTRITLICDPVEHEPVFINTTSTCEYIFFWKTPVACPRHMTVGDGCQVTDPLYGNHYDLQPLRNNAKDYNVSDGIHSYQINICGPLVSKCDGDATSNSSVCQSNGKEQFSGGLASSQLTFNDGTLLMKFTGGSGGCEGNLSRSSQILFICNHEDRGFYGPIFMHEVDCMYIFIWQTSLACPPFTVVDCSITTPNGTFYDLSELSSPLMNEDYFTPNHSSKYVLNVCRSIVHSKDSRCPYKSAACIVDLEHKNNSISIGEVSSGPSVENGKLKLKYERGSPCKSRPSVQSETIIEFICDTQSNYPYPQLVTEENCKYYFEWATPVACPISSPSTETTGVQIGTNCQVTNPITSYLYDLNSLRKDTGYEVAGANDLHMILNVCDSVDPGKCRGGSTGVCTYTHDDKSVISAGVANAELHFLRGFLFLRYSGGEKCPNGLERSTFISFYCGAEGSQEGPFLVQDDLDNCTYYINWHTELVCERRIDCFVDTWERRIDLSPLILTTGNYETVNPKNHNQTFYLNVCRPLNHMAGLLCHAGSSACLTYSSGSSTLNLGHPTVTPVNTYDEGVQLMNSAGSVCPSNPGLPITSKIIFICVKDAGVGNPVFKEVTHDCQYIFEWETSLVCEEEVPESGPVCQIMFEAAKTNVNLNPLFKSDGYEVKYNDKTFKINVCGSVCNNSGVCTADGKSYGVSMKSELRWDYDTLKLTYYGGDTCMGSISGHKTTAIYFHCDMESGYGTPVADDFMEDLDCMAVFKWKTNVTCIEGIYNTDDVPLKPTSSTNATVDTGGEAEFSNTTAALPSSDKKDEEPVQSTVTTVIATVLVVSGIIFVIVLVLLKSQRGQRAMASARRLFGITGYTDLTQSQAESSTLLGTTSRVFRVDDSDDDLLRV